MHICSGSPDPLLDTPLPSLYKLNKLKRLPHIEFIELNLHLFKSLCATSYIHLISVHCTAVYARARNLRVFVERNSRVSFLRSLHFFEFWIYEENDRKTTYRNYLQNCLTPFMKPGVLYWIRCATLSSVSCSGCPIKYLC